MEEVISSTKNNDLIWETVQKQNIVNGETVLQGTTTAKKKIMDNNEEKTSRVESTELGLNNHVTTDLQDKSNTPHISDGTTTPGMPQNPTANAFDTYYKKEINLWEPQTAVVDKGNIDCGIIIK